MTIPIATTIIIGLFVIDVPLNLLSKLLEPDYEKRDTQPPVN
jgi:hypothetical protein